jgi:hypothetical protein
MSDTPAIPTPAETPAEKTPEQIASETKRAERQAIIDAKVAELKGYEGKTFARNDGTGGPVKVLKYMGIHVNVNKGYAEYMFNVERTGHYNANLGATDFLAEHHVIETLAVEDSLPH